MRSYEIKTPINAEWDLNLSLSVPAWSRDLHVRFGRHRGKSKLHFEFDVVPYGVIADSSSGRLDRVSRNKIAAR